MVSDVKARTKHMTPPPFDPARPDVVRPVRVDPEGEAGPTRAQARGRRWRRTSHGFYLPATVDSTIPEQRIVEAAHDLGDNTAVTGWAALRWHGAEWFNGTSYGGAVQLPVELTTVRNSTSPQQGMAATSECIPPRDRMIVDGLRVVTPVCAVAYMMRYARHLVDGVRAFDMAAMADLISRSELLDHLELLYHWTGIPQAREAADLCDENAWSPPEVDSRLVWPLELGLDAPLTNRPIFDLSGRHIGTPDLIDVEAGLAVDYDGSLHLAGARRAKDLVREDGFRKVGLEYLTLVAADRSDRHRLATRVRAARARSPYTPPAERRWTVEPPPWWVPTHSVALRRQLTVEQKERLLRYRRAG